MKVTEQLQFSIPAFLTLFIGAVDASNLLYFAKFGVHRLDVDDFSTVATSTYAIKSKIGLRVKIITCKNRFDTDAIKTFEES